MAHYIALMRKEAGSDFGVDFPDFPGCITAGRTLDEAKEMAGEALAFHIEGMGEDGETLPEPASLEAVMADPFNTDAVAFLVAAPMGKERVVRVNVTLPESLLNRIAEYTRSRHLNRSAFLANAAIRALKEDDAV